MAFGGGGLYVEEERMIDEQIVKKHFRGHPVAKALYDLREGRFPTGAILTFAEREKKSILNRAMDLSWDIEQGIRNRRRRALTVDE